MAQTSSIEWTDATWNPITGCSVVSPGCQHCYAMKLAGTRLANIPSRTGLTVDTKAGPVWTGEVRFNEQWLRDPLRWRRPRRIFVCAHGDLFHEKVPDSWIDQVFAVMALAPQHTFQVLTKRAERMRTYMTDAATVRRIYEVVCDLVVDGSLPLVLIAPGIDERHAPAGPRIYLNTWPLPDVWLGVSAEDQQRADERIPNLLQTPAVVRFLSGEPLLGPLDLASPLYVGEAGITMRGYLRSHSEPDDFHFHAAKLDWVIVGGESGQGARPMHPAWARSLRDQCAAAEVPFFFKQWGEHRPLTPKEHGQACGASLIGSDPRDRDAYVLKVGKKAAGRLLDGLQHDAMPRVR